MFNQLMYDEIFELKKRYYEVLQLLEYANPFVQNLNQLISAKRVFKEKKDQKSLQELFGLIPKEITAPPKLEDISRETLIEEVSKIKVG